MMVKENISIEDIKKMSYVEFVGFINQWNVLPGAHTTLSKWRTFANINEKSNILEIACSTGFSSRELAILTDCRGKAIDISKQSIQSAINNKKEYASKIKIDYLVEDAYHFATKEKFSHIIIGAALKFFPEPQVIIDKFTTLLDESGYILASPFYIKSTIPKELVDEFRAVFGFTPTTESYKEIMKGYKELEIVYEDHNDIIQETKEELDYYCTCTVKRVYMTKNLEDKEIYKVIYDRLYQIKEMSNKLRPYQRYVVLVLRYRSKLFPNRYIELF